MELISRYIKPWQRYVWDHFGKVLQKCGEACPSSMILGKGPKNGLDKMVLDHEEKKRTGRDGRAVDQVRGYPSWVPWDGNGHLPVPILTWLLVTPRKRK